MKADLILFNGKIHSFNTETPNVTAIAIKDGKFVAVGNDTSVKCSDCSLGRIG